MRFRGQLAEDILHCLEQHAGEWVSATDVVRWLRENDSSYQPPGTLPAFLPVMVAEVTAEDLDVTELLRAYVEAELEALADDGTIELGQDGAGDSRFRPRPAR